MSTPQVALTIAGTDSGGGAGVAADLATFAALGVHGACAVTAVTAQDTVGVHRVVQLSAEAVAAQVDAVLADLPVAVVKTGMLGTADIAEVVARLPPSLPLVVDPVLVASSGAVLGDEDVLYAYRSLVLPRATVITPNREEALRLAGAERSGGATLEELVEVARTLRRSGPAVVLTGGGSQQPTCQDVVVDRHGSTHLLEHRTVATRNDHGTGCTFSAALAVALARGQALPSAARSAQSFVAAALHASARWRLGRGRGPVAHTQQTRPITTRGDNPCTRTPAIAPSTAPGPGLTSGSRSSGSA